MIQPYRPPQFKIARSIASIGADPTDLEDEVFAEASAIQLREHGPWPGKLLVYWDSADAESDTLTFELLVRGISGNDRVWVTAGKTSAVGVRILTTLDVYGAGIVFVRIDAASGDATNAKVYVGRS